MAVSPTLRVDGLVKNFPLGGLAGVIAAMSGRERPTVHAVDGVTFEVGPGETLGLVGESGCGKSTVARCILRLIEPTSGRIEFEGVDVASLEPDALQKIRRHMQMVFQDPTASLNPRLTAQRVVEEPLRVHTELGAAERRERTAEVLEEVGLGAELGGRYPHELSGGQRQRVNIARAIATSPRFVALDEPTSALDVSLRSRIILLLQALRERHGLSYLFISHDLATVKYLAARVAVMYLGVIVEEAPVEELFARPQHPYTRALLSAVPVPDPDAKKERLALAGEVPSPIDLPPGCRLKERCPFAQAVCAEPVALREVAPRHRVACHLV
jgi:oligopeptide/dipeptide ABC transporter ATP-binding protein